MLHWIVLRSKSVNTYGMFIIFQAGSRFSPQVALDPMLKEKEKLSYWMALTFSKFCTLLWTQIFYFSSVTRRKGDILFYSVHFFLLWILSLHLVSAFRDGFSHFFHNLSLSLCAYLSHQHFSMLKMSLFLKNSAYILGCLGGTVS